MIVVKSKKAFRIISISLVAVLVAVGLLIFLGNGSGELLAEGEAARRPEGVPADGLVYVDTDAMVALAGELSGTAESKAAAKAAFDQINAERASKGLGALKWSDGLETASAVRAVECSSVWSHNRPDGTEYWTVNSNLVYGENLAKGFSSAGDAFVAWKNSPTHYDNIIFPDFKTAAIAIHIIGNQWYWANEFGY